MLLQALRVEIEMKNLNIQVTFPVQKGVGTRSHLTTPLDKQPLKLLGTYVGQIYSRTRETEQEAHDWYWKNVSSQCT